MLKAPQIFCSAIVASIAFIVTGSGYAERVEVACRPTLTSPAQEKNFPGIDGVQYSLTFDGVEVEGYSRGIIKKAGEEGRLEGMTRLLKEANIKGCATDNDLRDFSIIADMHFQITATCVGLHGKSIDFKESSDPLFICPEGYGLKIALLEPTCCTSKGEEDPNPNKKAIFTLETKTKQKQSNITETEKVKLVGNVFDKNFVGFSNGEPVTK